ncbi:transmembrane protein, putative (macronuclear) [Tetrahymena thermophila SB210]|uniref:Transmembrane protein, putative n=1 Tax=Tetrahymena thermophila (strain SB210) TaxID=312017 RepID=W7XBU5_TETTS|nr:transmembrane protein, putative [Tetrahymena thermophila SB210]EWS71156.1 transmembrane protein, putative [Tetrahymena thermophila SB210]|eukprot:XP_012656297.1 transmembrane protein, putative [Tetrahymena thermophila SB210]
MQSQMQNEQIKYFWKKILFMLFDIYKQLAERINNKQLLILIQCSQNIRIYKIQLVGFFFYLFSQILHKITIYSLLNQNIRLCKYAVKYINEPATIHIKRSTLKQDHFQQIY